MSKQHTPGPWKIDWYICREGNKEMWRVPRSIGPAYVDHNHWAGNYITVDEADARLIAAAPDLLEALKFITKYIEPTAVDAASMQKAARAAIKQAEEN